VPRAKNDKKLLENMQLGNIMEMPFAKPKRVKFEPEFEHKDMMKLEAKQNLPKMTREERLNRQKTREQELNTLLAQ